MAQAFADGASQHATVPCPVCGTPLKVGLLEITEDDGEVVKLFTFDCPEGDYHGILRGAEVIERAAQEVVRRLRHSS